jgi:hypothetical protein
VLRQNQREVIGSAVCRWDEIGVPSGQNSPIQRGNFFERLNVWSTTVARKYGDELLNI